MTVFDDNRKKKLYSESERVNRIRFFIMGMKSLKRSFLKKTFVIFNLVLLVFALITSRSCIPEKPEVFKDVVDIFPAVVYGVTVLLFAALLYIALILFGMPKESLKFRDNLTRTGMTNHAGEAPMLISKKRDNNNPRIMVLTFYALGFPLSYWQDHKEIIETGMNIVIDRIEQGNNRNTFVVYATDGNYQLPDRIDWDTALINSTDSVLILGESIARTVEVDLSKIPHLLLGGSTGSGKTILLKLLLMQCAIKGFDVYIADFKGGVDFNKSWKYHANIITEPKELVACLDNLVTELHQRKHLFAELDCSNINEYKERFGEHMQRIIFGCDEVAELLDKTGLDKKAKDIIAKYESCIATIARLGRAFGIHLILATQRPDANIISGQIKNNIDFRACGRADNVLSQIILDKTDANNLISKTAQGRFLTNTDVLFQAYYFDDSKGW